MNVLGIDPGATSGWVVYDSVARRVIASGEFCGDDLPAEVVGRALACGCVVIESLHEPRGGIYPAVVVAGITQGHIERQLRGLCTVHRVTRHEAKLALTAATLGEPVARDDATAWQAIVVLHGAGSDAKPRTKKGVVIEAGGALGLVTGHARAALAAVVAFVLRQEAARAAKT